MNYVAPYITGRYDFTFVPIPLPTAYVESLLPPTSSLLTPSELASLDLDVPPAGDGNSWVTLEVGQQIKTGMAIPGGKSTFYEAKLQIPFIAPQGRTAAITYKHTLLFSSLLMRYSSSLLTGLDSYHSKFDKRDGGYSVGDWMEVRAGESGEGGWGEELVRACVGGWWIGSGTKGNALRFEMTPLETPKSRDVVVRLRLPAFTRGKDVVRDDSLQMDDDGWVEVSTKGWELSEATTMEVKSLASL